MMVCGDEMSVPGKIPRRSNIKNSIQLHDAALVFLDGMLPPRPFPRASSKGADALGVVISKT
jgi:hypothetical protein